MGKKIVWPLKKSAGRYKMIRTALICNALWLLALICTPLAGAMFNQFFNKGDFIMNNGQLSYEFSRALAPTYHDGTKRKAWHELCQVAQWSWSWGRVNMFENSHFLPSARVSCSLGISLTGNYFQYQQAQGCFIMPSAVPPISISKGD